MIQSAGVIAAGEGIRFKKVGIQTHKPLIPVAGFPLIGHTLNYFKMLGIRRVVIIFNELEMECVEWVRKNFSTLTLEFIVKSTKSSFESFWMVGQKLGSGRHLISTVDSFCAPEELGKIARENGTENIFLGVTSFVDDEKPLWVNMDEKTGRITELGGKSGSCATCGFYNVRGELFNQKPQTEIASLRYYLKWLIEQGVPAYGISLSNVVDIDSPKDVEVAEKMLKGLKCH